MNDQLFDERDIAPSQWETFLDSTKAYKPRLIDTWLKMFSDWHRLYESFRDLEKRSMYDVEDEKIGSNNLRAHRHAVSFINASGEDLDVILDRISDDLGTNEKQESLTYKMRLGTLLESLRESMELWHPANKGPSSMNNLFES